ncbi:AAA family ATPase [Thiohalocapsa marina]|uniref:Uncharacterized AAA domain-containing protein ycf46 n=1 Tax=Thiohalocapsa marina TaxID=424902 RepID=A0A5M8FPT8_9GAMM|nr:AAA family ATPase [Thiohalocapsa marina]KAA6186923.1 AAA family ATPase [Thiohalocapsa marina]
MRVQGRKTLQTISRGLRSRYPIFYLLGWEEDRMEQLLGSVAGSYYGADDRFVVWTATGGFSQAVTANNGTQTDPVAALRAIADSDREAIYLMKDLPAWLDDNPALVRAVRDLYYRLRNRNTHVFLSYPQLVLPEILKKEVFVIDMDLPSEPEILERLEQGPHADDATPDQRYRFAAAMRGLSLNEVEHLQARLFRGRSVDTDLALREILEEKAQLLRKESCLQFYPHQGALEDIGGLENLKEWVTKRKDMFSEKAHQSGVPLPSGVLFMGISGCGKSLAAKAIAAAWNLPLVRMDMSLVLSGSYGAPEYAFAHATRMAEAVAPVVLWVDEIENSFGYDDQAGGSGGGNINIFSSFLTWLQEKAPGVFVAATANRIQSLPAELMRKGRFDQLFFLDLPHKDDRKQIFRIHIRNNGADPTEFNLDYLAASTPEWSGAEIEQAVKAARVDAYQEDRAFNERDLVNNIVSTIPLSRTMVEQIKALREWCHKRAINASRPAVPDA